MSENYLKVLHVFLEEDEGSKCMHALLLQTTNSLGWYASFVKLCNQPLHLFGEAFYPLFALHWSWLYENIMVPLQQKVK